MIKKIYIQAIFIWLLFAIITIFFGAFRELFFIPFTGLNGNLARALLLPLAFFYLIGITYIFLKKTKAVYQRSDMIKIGIFWFTATILFEFGFGHFVMGHPFEKLMADYNLFEGKTWAFFLLCIFLAPTITYKYLLKK